MWKKHDQVIYININNNNTQIYQCCNNEAKCDVSTYQQQPNVLPSEKLNNNSTRLKTEWFLVCRCLVNFTNILQAAFLLLFIAKNTSKGKPQKTLVFKNFFQFVCIILSHNRPFKPKPKSKCWWNWHLVYTLLQLKMIIFSNCSKLVSMSVQFLLLKVILFLYLEKGKLGFNLKLEKVYLSRNNIYFVNIKFSHK